MQRDFVNIPKQILELLGFGIEPAESRKDFFGALKGVSKFEKAGELGVE